MTANSKAHIAPMIWAAICAYLNAIGKPQP